MVALTGLQQSLPRQPLPRPCRRNKMSTKASKSAGVCQGFSNRQLSNFKVGIMGDLHLEPSQMHLFHDARDQFVKHFQDGAGRLTDGARMVQLGDLGGYKHQPGSLNCFTTAHNFLSSFPTPSALILGNHDLEGAEFETDEDNLAAWQQVFQQHHHWAADLGPALLIGLSTTRFRSNVHSVHEVHIDEEQLQWFRSTLESAKGRPVVVFSHAPPMGSGLKVLQEVHVKNRCAWLNHSSNPSAFLTLVEQYPNIRLWFSGHFHLSHNYSTSVSAVGRTVFVQTGVIGECNRDGFRHSRVLEGDESGFRVYTLDHDLGGLRLDVEGAWSESSPPQIHVPEEELLCDPNEGWLCSQLDCDIGEGPRVQWLPAGPRSLLALQEGLLVEYDPPSRAPVGLVAPIPDGVTLTLEGPSGAESTSDDGSDVVAVVLRESGVEVGRYPRNEQGGFYQIYQVNKWRVRKEREREEAMKRGEVVKELQVVGT